MKRHNSSSAAINDNDTVHFYRGDLEHSELLVVPIIFNDATNLKC